MLRRALVDTELSKAVLIQIDDDASIELLEIRWKTSLQLCKEMLEGRTWRVVSFAPSLERFKRN